MPHHGLGPIRFASYLALAWLGLVVYGSLHPFAGWRDTGVSPFAFLEGGWPRYWTVFDLAANVAVYLPLGFFLGLALSRLRGRFTGMALATLLAGAISFGLESVQTWLPSRVPSNLDLACNTLGGLLGALWAQAVGPRVLLRITALEHKLIAPVPHAELGLTLPEIVPPLAAYLPAVLDGSRVYVSGQVPMVGGVMAEVGHVGEGDRLVSPERAKELAAVCALNALAAVKSVVGDLDRVERVVKVVGFVASDPSFTGQPGVINGASELFADVFGDAGRHARSAVGVTALPLGAPVEVEVIVHVRD